MPQGTGAEQEPDRRPAASAHLQRGTINGSQDWGRQGRLIQPKLRNAGRKARNRGIYALPTEVFLCVLSDLCDEKIPLPHRGNGFNCTLFAGVPATLSTMAGNV